VNLVAPPPPSETSKTKALILSALVHIVLIGALFFGVQWKSQAPSSVEVEVWRAAPPPVVRPQPVPEVKPEPKPEPKPVAKPEPTPTIKPDIAIKEKPKKEEPKKPEPKPEPKAEPKPIPPDFKKELASDLQQLDRQKAAEEARERAQAEAKQLAQLKADQASAARTRGLDDWSNKVRNKIRNNIVVPPNVVGNPEAVFGITQLVSGDIIEVKLRKSSGNKLLDEAIERAILKSSPLPKPDQADLYQRSFELKVRPLAE